MISSGLPVRVAVEQWGQDPRRSRRAVRVVARIRLGESVGGALSALDRPHSPDGSALAMVLGLGGTYGGNVGTMLNSLATSMSLRDDLERKARVATSGPRTSARLVGALPLLFALLAAPAGAQSASLGTVAGLVLALAGAVWMRRLLPAPPVEDHPVACCCDLVASLIEGGMSLHVAWDAVAPTAPSRIRHELADARRRVGLGVGWARSLEQASDPGLRRAGAALVASAEMGAPCAPALRGLARTLRMQMVADLEATIARASVLMVLPLTLCSLPAFLLLAVGPALRGLAR